MRAIPALPCNRSNSLPTKDQSAPSLSPTKPSGADCVRASWGRSYLLPNEYQSAPALNAVSPSSADWGRLDRHCGGIVSNCGSESERSSHGCFVRVKICI